MDTNDLSGDETYRAHFKQLKENAERASRRKGETPRDHPPPQFLVARFMGSRIASEGVGSQQHQISTSQVPPGYPPSVRPFGELTTLMISRMVLEHHHRDSRAMVRILTPPDRMTAVMAIVEDEEGTAVLLQLYNQPEEPKVSKERILQAGDICIIKEPFFKATVDGSYALRVDHVSDIIWLEDTDDRIPSKWRKRVSRLGGDSQDIRKQGNAAVQKRNWAEAECLYTQAIRTATTPEEEQLAYLNRALANLHLDRPEKALSDASKASANIDTPNEKALFREARAFYLLRKFKPCMEKLLALVRCNPRNTEAWAEIKRVKQRLKEEETGSYQFETMYRQAEATPPLVDCATYVGPVAVRDSEGRGKGLFTTRLVKVGELLFCEKAFAYSYASNDSDVGRSNMTILMNLSTNTITVGGQAHLITQVVQKMYHDPISAKVFTDLHHGDYAPVEICEVDGAPVVDTFLAVKIIQLNCFGAPRFSNEHTKTAMDGVDGKVSKKPSAHSTCGIWPLASRINHSCVSNCRRSFIGDMQIVRACEDMEAGTELHFGYKPPLPHQTYEEAQESLRTWGFVCDCALCVDRKSTARGTIEKRKRLVDSLEGVLEPGASIARLKRAVKTLQDLENTYTASQDALVVPRLELWSPYLIVGTELIAKNRTEHGLEMLLKCLEALGFSVVAYPPRSFTDGEGQRRLKLEIKRWGQSDGNLHIFWNLMQAYEELAPELCKIADEYVGIAYSICYGEKETVGALRAQLL